MENLNLEALAAKAAESLDLAGKANLQAKIDAVLGIDDGTLALAFSADPVEKGAPTSEAERELFESLGSRSPGAFAGVKSADEARAIALSLAAPDPNTAKNVKVAMLKRLFVGLRTASDAALVAKAIGRVEAQ